MSDTTTQVQEIEKTVETSRCSGHCCQGFYLNESKLDLLTSETVVQDEDIIVDMLIPLEWDEEGGATFTCRHFDTETNNCQIYDRRPGMCRNYPYGKECSFPGCTYTTTATKEKTDA